MENKKEEEKKEIDRKEEESLILNMKLHDFYVTKTSAGQVLEITRVLNGWVYNFHFPDTRIDQIVYIPQKN